MNENFTLELISALDQNKSKKKINSDIKMLEKTINMLRLTGTFAKGNTKKELNDSIRQLSNQLSMIKLKAKMDSKELKNEIDKTLSNLSFKEIDALNINENKTKLKMRKVFTDLRSYADRVPIGVNVEYKKQKLENDLTAYLNKNTKINESSALLKEAEKVRELIHSVGDKKTLREATDAFQLYKSEVAATGFNTKSTTDKIKNMLSHISKISSAFGVASMAVNNFVKSLKTLQSNDTILTEISKTSDLTKQQLKEIGDESFKIASKYGKLSSNYLLGVQEMARAGYGNSDTMAELSTKVQGAGDMTADLANKYIIATDKAFQMNGSIETLTRTLDGANNITNHNALSMSDLAEAMSIVGTQAASSGMEVDETTAALATMIAVTQQSGSQMGNAFKGILMNLQQVTGEVEDGGEAIDAESLTKYEKACAELGVSLSTVKDGIVSLKEPMQIIKELSDAYTKLDKSDVKRANLLNAVGGKYRANALNSLLENYDMYSKMMNEYANGLGSMDEEAEKTALSWEGRLNSLQNSWDSFVNELTNKDAMLGGISFFDKLIQGAEVFVDRIGEIPVLLTALNTSMAALNKDYGITQIWNGDEGKIDIEGNLFGIDFTQFKNMKKHFEEAEVAIEKWNARLMVGKVDINDFNESVVQNNAQLKDYLSTTSKDAPASLAGYKASLNAAGVSTDALRLKTVLLNAAISFGIGLAIQATIQGISYLVQKQEELRRSAVDAAEEFNNLKSKSESLNSELKTTRDRIEELEKKPNLTFVEQEELRKLKEANEELERQNELNKTLLGVAETKARNTAVDFLEKKTSYEQYGEWDMSQVLNDNSNYGQRKAGEIFQGNLLEVAKIQLTEYEDLLKRKKDVEKRIQEFQLANPDVDNYTAEQKGQFANLTMELNSYDDTLHALKTTLYETVPELDSFKASLNPDYDQSYIDSINEIVDGYADLFGDTGKNVTDRFNEVWESTDFSSARDQLEKLSKAGKLTPEVLESNEQYRKLLEETGKTASEVCQNIHALVEAEGNLGNTSDSPTLFNKEEMISAINELSEGFEELDKIYSSISDEKPFDFKLLDDDKFKETFSGLGDAYTDFIETISDSPNDITECQKAFDGLLTVWLNTSPVLKNVSEDTAALTTSMLSNMGVANAEELVTQALADNHARLAAEKYYEATASAALEGATANEVARILQEAEAAGIDAQELARIAIGKMTANGVQVNTAGDIANILALSNAAWGSVGALQALANAKAGVFGAATGMAAGALDAAKNVGKSKPKYQASYGGGNKSNKSGGGSGGGSGSGSAKEATVFDFMDKKIENLNTEIDKLKDNMDSVSGYKNKNSFADSIIQDYERQIDIYNQMIAEYQKKANEISLPTEYIEKIKNGAIEIESISDEALVKQIQDYQKWQKEIDDCSKSIYDIKNNIQDLKYEKIDNIIDQYDDLNKSMKDVIDTQENLIELMEESGEQSVGIDDYEDLVEKQVSYAEQNAEAIEKVRDEMRRLNVTEESDKWMEYNEQIKDYESNMISAAKAVEKYKDKMVELTYKVLDDYKSKMDIINNTVSTMHDLIGDEHLLDDDGQLTNRGMAQVALYAQELAHAKQTAEEYAHAMHSLDKVLSEGLITEDEYNEKLKDYRASQEDAVAATKKAQEAILDLIKDSIQAEIDAKKDDIDATKNQLRAEQELNSYRDSIAEKSRKIAILQKQIDTLSLSSDRKDMAQKLQLQEQLAELQKELYEEQSNQTISDREEALDQELDAFTKEKEKEIKELESDLSKQNAAIEEYLEKVKANYSTVYSILNQYGENYNLEATEDLTTPWNSGSEAANLCASAVGDAVAQINYELANIDTSPLYALIEALQNVGLNGFGEGNDDQWEDVTGQGKWTKGKHGWWYGSSDDDYVSDGYYTINGKTYNFNEDGYMKSGWDDSQGDWYYFEPENGEMVKSTWRKDKKGDWYYLQSDGSMARDAAVKAKDGNGYYVLDSDGKWDGKTLTKKEVEELGYQIAYQHGSKNSIGGRIKFDEEGLGSEVILTKHGGFMQVPAGSHIFSSEQAENLWQMSKGNLDIFGMEPWKKIDSSMIKNNIPNIEVQNSVNIQGDASEKTIGLIQNALDDFSKNRMAKEFNKQLRYQIKK